MTTAMVEGVAIQNGMRVGQESANQSPEQSAEIFGLDILALQRLGFLAIDVGIADPGLGSKLHALPQAANLIELAIQAKQSGHIGYDALKAHQDDITVIDRRARFAFRLAKNEHFRNWMMGKVNEQIPGKLEKAMDGANQSAESIKDLQEKIELITSFDNPREQFEQEVNSLADTVHEAILEQRDLRLSSGVQPKLETPAGIRGLLVRAYRSVKKFFGGFKVRKEPTVDENVSAYDVGMAVEKIYQKVADKDIGMLNKIPMIAGLAGDQFKKYASKVTQNNIAFGAPEVLELFASISPDKARWQKLLRSVESRPHEFRFVTRYIKKYKGRRLSIIQNAANQLLPAMKAVLPTDATIIRQAYADIQQLLSPSQQSTGNVESDDADKPVTIKHALKQTAKDKKDKLVSKLKSRAGKLHKQVKQTETHS